VLEIESLSYEHPWGRNEFIRALKDDNTVGAVVEDADGWVLGFVVYAREKSKLVILNLAIDPAYRRKGCGSFVVNKLKSRLKRKISRISTMIRETNFSAIGFLRRNGFLATEVIRTPYDEISEDGIIFTYDSLEFSSPPAKRCLIK
jgi:ribosomal protein S18 acetylase RimI-like enzyme